MTDNQLAILKSAERQILKAALEAAGELMPQAAPRRLEHVRAAIGASCVTVIGKCPESHYKPGDDFLALEPFLEILESLDEQIALLKGI